MAIKKAIKTKRPLRDDTIIAMGFDISTYSIAGCARSYDPLLGKTFGPRWAATRWNKQDHIHWDKLKILANAFEFIFQLQNKLGAGGVVKDISNIHIGVEELPARVMNSQSYREQGELCGAFLGGLLKYGFTNVYSVNVMSWHKIVADDLDMPLKGLTKFDVKQWAKEVYDAPKWPDLIRTDKMGLIPMPKTSKAKPSQADDRYDSTGIMEWVVSEKLGGLGH